ncbi:MAG: CAP domain-containing protein [Candidatus Acidiferrum sp.]
MKIVRFARAAGALATFCFLFFLFSVRSQDRPPVPPPASSRTFYPSADEKVLFDDANSARAAAGVQPLKWDAALAAAARQHAALMAHEILLSHQYPDELPLAERAGRAGAKFSLIAENVAMGFTADTIHEGWMHSPGHRKNILNPELASVGIATIRGTRGLFAVQDFSRPVAELSLEQQEAKVISLLERVGMRGAIATEEARKTCGTDRVYENAPVTYVSRFEVTTLDELPDQLLQQIKRREYRKAEVGACLGGDEAGFTRYRLAVVLH